MALLKQVLNWEFFKKQTIKIGDLYRVDFLLKHLKRSLILVWEKAQSLDSDFCATPAPSFCQERVSGLIRLTRPPREEPADFKFEPKSSLRRLLCLCWVSHGLISGSHSYIRSSRLLRGGGTTDGLCLSTVCRILFLVIILLRCRTAYLLLWAGLFHHPVEDEIILVAHAVEQVLEQLSKITNVGLFLELETATVVKINSELIGEVLCQCFNRGGQLLVSNFLVLFLLSAGWEALPGQAALIEVHQHEAEGL